jgi:hypothetical protein
MTIQVFVTEKIMPEQETEVVPVHYFVDVGFEDASGNQAFGPIASRAKAEDLLIALASRTDVQKATLRREVTT